MAMRSVCHSVDNLHEERCAPEIKYASLQAKCVVQGHIYIIWNDEGHGAQCRRQPRRGIAPGTMEGVLGCTVVKEHIE